MTVKGSSINYFRVTRGGGVEIYVGGMSTVFLSISRKNSQRLILKNYFRVFLSNGKNSILSRCSAITSTSKYTKH